MRFPLSNYSADVAVIKNSTGSMRPVTVGALPPSPRCFLHNNVCKLILCQTFLSISISISFSASHEKMLKFSLISSTTLPMEFGPSICQNVAWALHWCFSIKMILSRLNKWIFGIYYTENLITHSVKNSI